VHDLLVMCPATNLKRLTYDESCPYSLVNDAGLRPPQTCVMICLLILASVLFFVWEVNLVV
jgi:hypothetical protein